MKTKPTSSDQLPTNDFWIADDTIIVADSSVVSASDAGIKIRIEKGRQPNRKQAVSHDFLFLFFLENHPRA